MATRDTCDVDVFSVEVYSTVVSITVLATLPSTVLLLNHQKHFIISLTDGLPHAVFVM